MYKLLYRVCVRANIHTPPCASTSVHRSMTQIKRNVEKSKVSDLKKYWFNRYVDYIKNYETVLEKNFPKAMHVYRVFSIGTKDFYRDLKRYLAVRKKQNLHGIHSLTREELQLYYTVRQDLIRISPLLLISAVPFTNYIIFPLAYYFPRHLLTSHYWTLQQRLEFMLLDHKKRLKHNKPLLRCMQAELNNIKNQGLKVKWSDIVACLGSGTHPLTKDIIACSELFMGQPFSLDALRRKHVKELLAIHGMSGWRPFRRRRLMERGMLIKQMDLAIQKEGGVSQMSNDAIRWALSFRGVNPMNMSIESMKDWLEKWLTVSQTVDKRNLSLLLHSPILLAYNHSTNWILLYN